MIDLTPIYKKYRGMWVALTEDAVSVLGAGKTVQEAIDNARKKGEGKPFLFKVPTRSGVYIGSKNEV